MNVTKTLMILAFSLALMLPIAGATSLTVTPNPPTVSNAVVLVNSQGTTFNAVITGGAPPYQVQWTITSNTIGSGTPIPIGGQIISPANSVPTTALSDGYPSDIIFDTARNQAYILEGSDIKVMNLATNAITGTMTGAFNAYTMAFDGNYLYVQNNGVVFVFNVISQTHTATITTTGYNVGSLSMNNATDSLYMATGTSNVLVANTITDTVVNTINTGQVSDIILVSPKGNVAYTDTRGSNVIPVIGLASNSVVANIGLQSGYAPQLLAFNSNGSRAYVSQYSGDDALSIIDTSANSVLRTISSGLGASYLGASMEINPSGTMAYVSQSSGAGGSPNLSFFNLVTNTLLYNIPYTKNSQYVHIYIVPSSNGNLAYMTNGSAYINVINLPQTNLASPATNSIAITAYANSANSIMFTFNGATTQFTNVSQMFGTKFTLYGFIKDSGINTLLVSNTFTINSLAPSFTYNAVSNVIDAGQYQQLNFVISNQSVSPYTYNILVYNAIGSQVYNSLFYFNITNSTKRLNYSTFYLQNSIWGTGNFMANIIISNNYAQSTSNSLTYKVNSPLIAANILLVSNTILTAMPSGGTPPYAYKWYSSSSSSCSPKTLMAGQTANTYTPTLTSYYCYVVSDATNAINGTQKSTFSVFGDSITAASYLPAGDGWAQLMQTDPRITTQQFANGGWSLTVENSLIGISGIVANLITPNIPNQVWIEIGTNDGYASVPVSQFQTEYDWLLQNISVAAPKALIYAQAPYSESAYSSYSNSINYVCSLNSHCLFVNSSQVLLPGDTTDGVHPTIAGDVKYWLWARSILEPYFGYNANPTTSNAISFTSLIPPVPLTFNSITLTSPLNEKQTQTITTYVYNGVSAYTYNVLVYNAIGNLVTNQLTANALTYNSFTFTQNATWGYGLFTVNSIVTDSNSPATTVSHLSTYSVNNPLSFTSTPTLPATLAPGQSITFMANVNLGTQPYSFNYILSNTVSGSIIASQLYTGVSTTYNSFTWVIPGSALGNTIEANVLVTSTGNTNTIGSSYLATLLVAEGAPLGGTITQGGGGAYSNYTKYAGPLANIYGSLLETVIAALVFIAIILAIVGAIKGGGSANISGGFLK